jgi:hypothetical protein
MDRLGGSRLADVVDRGPPGEALVLEHVAENPQGFDVHNDILS